MNKLSKLKIFLQNNFPNIQAFNTRNLVGDPMVTVYDEDGITVDYCQKYDYIEIFGLTQSQFESLLDENSFLGDNLKTFDVELLKILEIKDDKNNE